MKTYEATEAAYKNGYKHGKADAMKWIPVSEGKPENDYGKHWKERKHYLVRLQNGTMRVARYGYKDYGWWIDSHDCVLAEIRHTGVTHWMPLPELPKGE